jgi:hypothetical protein
MNSKKTEAEALSERFCPVCWKKKGACETHTDINLLNMHPAHDTLSQHIHQLVLSLGDVSETDLIGLYQAHGISVNDPKTWENADWPTIRELIEKMNEKRINGKRMRD